MSGLFAVPFFRKNSSLKPHSFSIYKALRLFFTRLIGRTWIHARRYFADALKALPKKDHQAAKDTVAYEAIKRIGAIYHLDNQLADLKPDDRKKQRQINLKPLVEAFFAWAKEIQASGRLSKGKSLDGINYCINQEEALKVFLDDGEVPLDNNATEGALRSFCLHKHAWKLIDSIYGA